MSLFKRRRDRSGEAEEAREADDGVGQPEADDGEAPDGGVGAKDGVAVGKVGGPRDASEPSDGVARLDLGALRVPVAKGMTVRLEVQASGRPVGVNISRDGSALQVQVFAAPRTLGIWDEIREELAQSITDKGGSAEEVTGRFGLELKAKVPAITSDGRTGKRSVRFIGMDGPRWFVRGMLTGKAATNLEVAAALEDVFAGLVVDRGTDAYPPRDLLPLTAPGAQPKASASEPDQSLDPLTRGPELTEVR
jgi:hypothetical protein